MDTSSLMEQILSSDNLNRAYLQVVRNKGAEGVDGMKYTELKEYLAKNGENIKEQLRTRKYKPQPVRRVEIPKPDGGVRNLGVPTVTDRFIQQAIAQVLTPIYEEQFHEHSYGFRPNRCAQQAILTALDMMNDGNDWIVDIDLEKFFDTVNHDKLMTIIGRTIKDGDVISIVRKYLVSGIMIDDEYEDSIVGTPQGGNLSPLLANIMLNELDKEMEKRGLNFVRYADDCIIMVGREMSANRVMRNISRFIEEKLGLKVNRTKSKVDRPQGLKYLGFGFYFDSRAHQFKAKPHAKSVAKFKKRMKELTCRSWGVSNSYKVEIHRQPCDSLPMVTDELGQKFVDNEVEVTVTRADGEVFFTRSFTKANFDACLDNDYRHTGILDGLVYDKVNGSNLEFAGSVSHPQTDEYIPVRVVLSSTGNVTIKRDVETDANEDVEE